MNQEEAPAERLPSGRHRLPREVVLESQRRRIIEAMIASVGTNGYEGTSVADVLERAGVSRATFYEHFSDKLDCFLAAHDSLVDSLLAGVGQVCSGAGDWTARVRSALAGLVERFAAHPGEARVALVEVTATGPDGRRRYRTALQRFTPFLEEGYDHAELRRELSALTLRMAVGSVASILFEEVAAGRAESLPDRVGELTFAALAPLLGPEAAARAAEQDRA
ncbi:MAG: TetR/AcrR family transcriptional regulator [Acidimicrobiaceae bacterium]|nr:TetR/AcrR family transcriptional regulator [Acidimicrobiaceae bacterium]